MSTRTDMTDDSPCRPASVHAVVTCDDDASGTTLELMRLRVAGLPLLQRHFLSFHAAGVRDVVLRVPPAILHEAEQLAHAYLPAGMRLQVTSRPLDLQRPAVRIEQAIDVVADPRLVAELVSLASAPGVSDLVCADTTTSDDVYAKSPYKVGVAEAGEAKPVPAEDASRFSPVGVAVRFGWEGASPSRGAAAAGVETLLSVGRYYWHRVRTREDARVATWKVLLATMKSTDGIYARTNRRVSLRISRVLLPTPVTANMVTMVTLACGLLGGWCLARGDYLAIVAGSLLAWFASMLDGVDGELARAKFQASPLGHWLEMVCDYAFYIAVATGLGAGFSRMTGQRIWLALGIAAASGVVLSFLAVAHMKRAYARRGSVNDFYRAYQRSVRSPTSSLLVRMTPHLTALVTRAAFPYYLVLFALLGLGKVVLVLFFLATQSFWIGAVVVGRSLPADASR